MSRVRMPDGCTGLDMADGTKYTGRPGDVVEVSREHARDINKSWYGGSGVMRGEEAYAIGTRTARVCTACAPTRRWNAWNTCCPRCGAPTLLEESE